MQWSELIGAETNCRHLADDKNNNKNKNNIFI